MPPAHLAWSVWFTILRHAPGFRPPRVYIMDNPQPNAFATGRDPQHAAVAVTTGLMQRMNREELAGVLAHELAHIRNRDTLIMTITATIAGAISMLAQFGLFFGGGHRSSNNGGLGLIGTLAMVILAPIAAMLVQMAISRTREYAADEIGARITGRPEWLASALAKLDAAAHAIPNEDAERNPATAHLFIVNPLSGHGMDSLFSTHPSTENRIAALERLAHDMPRDMPLTCPVTWAGRAVAGLPAPQTRSLHRAAPGVAPPGVGDAPPVPGADPRDSLALWRCHAL